MATLGLKSAVGAAKKGIIQGTKAAVDAIKAETIAAKSFTKASVGEKVLLKPHSKAFFKGREVRAVRSLDHLSEENLRLMARTGRSPRNAKGEVFNVHHVGQKEQGIYVEMSEKYHKVNNPRQHPFGNQKGKGVSKEERAEFNKFRDAYWKARAREELARRGIEL